MARITYTVEIAGVTDSEAGEFVGRLREMPGVVNVEQEHVGLDSPDLPKLEVFPNPIKIGDSEGYVICYCDEEERRPPHPLLWYENVKESYDYAVNCCMGQLDPVKLGSDQLSDYSNLCISWVRLCLRRLGCDDSGKFETFEEASAALPKLNWALLNPGKPLSEYVGE